MAILASQRIVWGTWEREGLSKGAILDCLWGGNPYFSPVATFRPNVALLLLDEQDRLLICERKNTRGAWQFPQGGMDDGETAQESLVREVWEEIGLPEGSYDILESRIGYEYLYPPGVKKKKKGNYDGQTQTYFLCRLKEGAPRVDVNQDPPEFQDYRWVDPAEFDLEWVPGFKQEVYRRVFQDFFGVALR